MLLFISVLVVNVKRFRYMQDQFLKIYARINDPLAQVQIAAHCYKVFAVMCHNGHLDLSHYIAIINRSSDDSWWKSNSSAFIFIGKT